MRNKRSIIIILLFLSVTLAVLIKSLNVKIKMEKNQDIVEETKAEESKFSHLEYYVLDNGKPNLSLEAESLKIINSENLFFEFPVGVVYGEEMIKFQASKGTFKGKTKELSLEENVKVETPTALHQSTKLYYNGQKKFLEASGQVESKYLDTKTRDNLFVTSNYVSSWLGEKRIQFLGSVKGQVKRPRVYEESFDFSAKSVEVNQLNSLVSLNENVTLDRSHYHLEAQKAEIFLENFNKKLKYYVLYDDIKLEEKLKMPDGTIQLRRAFSEKLEGYMAEAKVVLSGAPRVEQGEDLIKGYQITLRENVELVEVDDSQSSFDLKKDK